MGAQPVPFEAREIVVRRRGTDAGSGVADHHHVALAIRRKVEFRRRRFLVMDRFDAGDGGGEFDYALGRRGLGTVDPDEAAKGAVVADESIGDRADDRGRLCAEFFIQQILKPDHVGRAVGLGFVVHAMVRREGDDGAERGQAAEPLIQILIEGVRLALARRVFVLDEIGKGEIHDVGLARLFHEPDAGVEHEQGQIGRVHIRQGPPDEIEHVLDAVLFRGAPVGVLGREADGAASDVHSLSQLPAQLVLGGDGDDLRSGHGKSFEDGARAHKLRVGHHHLFAGVGIEVVIA